MDANPLSQSKPYRHDICKEYTIPSRSPENALPFVSVIIPAYRDAEGVETVITALLNQTYPTDRYEIIVVDNGSDDRTPDVLNRLAEQNPELVKATSELRRGSYAARNKGIELAVGEIFAFTDADCAPTTGWINAGVVGLKDTRAAAAGGSIKFTFKQTRPNAFEYLDSVFGMEQENYIARAGYAVTANLFVRRDVIESIGPFRAELVSGGDHEFGNRLIASGFDLIYLPEATIHHPARSTFGAIVKKARRIGQGEKQLADLGLVENLNVNWRNFAPALKMPVDPVWRSSMTFRDRIVIMITRTVARYANAIVRLT